MLNLYPKCKQGTEAQIKYCFLKHLYTITRNGFMTPLRDIKNLQNINKNHSTHKIRSLTHNASVHRLECYTNWTNLGAQTHLRFAKISYFYQQSIINIHITPFIICLRVSSLKNYNLFSVTHLHDIQTKIFIFRTKMKTFLSNSNPVLKNCSSRTYFKLFMKRSKNT